MEIVQLGTGGQGCCAYNHNIDRRRSNNSIYKFIFLNNNYQYQNKPGTDNNFNYNKEFNIIKNIFNLELMTYEQIMLAF